MMKHSDADHVDGARLQWETLRPDIDTTPMEILGRINRIALLTAPAIVSVMAEYDLDRGEFDVLATLRRSGAPFALRPTELCSSLLLTSGGLSNRLRRMERKGLVTRTQNEEDGRSQLITISPKGLNLVDQVFTHDMKVEAGLLSKLDEKHRSQLAEALKALCLTLEQ
nr:MarR family transcriptional regulator [uncultured Cohaesibacter sp.]